MNCRAVATTKTVVARLDRAIQYAAASRLITNVSGILGRPVKPGDDSGICDGRGAYLAAFHSLARLAISAVTGSRIADGVRENRGAGAGWVTPWRSTKIFRAAMCG
jgi:hypothetical protein